MKSGRRMIRAVLLLLPCLIVSLDSQDSPLSRAESLLRHGNARDALQILLPLRRAEPSNANVCQQIGIAYTQLQELPKAEEFYREAVRLNPHFWAARKNLGTVLWFLNRQEESEHEFEAVTKALPADPVPHLYLGLAAHLRRDFSRAKMQFEKAGALASENLEVMPAVLESYLAGGNVSMPEKMLEQLAAAETPDLALLSRTGALCLQYRYYSGAVAMFEKLVTAQPGSAETWRLLAEAYDGQGKPEPAYRAYARSLDADPTSEATYIALAEFASAHGNNDYALQAAGRGLERLPKSAGLLFEQGMLLALQGDRKKAEKSLTEASRLKPSWNLPLLAMGVAQLESGDVAQSAISFRKARTLDPHDFRAHYLYAAALAREAGRTSAGNRTEAIAALRKAIGLSPADARPHALLGQIEMSAGNPNAAALEWQTALRIDPQNGAALYQLGLFYQKQGKTEEAKQLLQRLQAVKTKMRGKEESLVQILRLVPAKPTP
jgi:tetratricopeptide (TPR) repeat protein